MRIPFFGTRDPAVAFERVLAQELDEVRRSRLLREQSTLTQDPALVGLAFSGGGIRSATFNLGILQALAGNLNLKDEGERIEGRDYLRRVDYLATVSGGGYIGSWLVSWMRRVGSKPAVTRLRENRQDPPVQEPWRRLEPDQIRFLRRYSSYLAPRSGLLSADTWTMVTIYLRNLILNLTLLVVVGAGVLLVPDLALWAMHDHLPRSVYLWSLLGVAVLVAAFVIGIGFGGVSDSPAPTGWRRRILRRVGLYTSSSLFASVLAGTLLLASQEKNSAQTLFFWIGLILATVAAVFAITVGLEKRPTVPPLTGPGAPSGLASGPEVNPQEGMAAPSKPTVWERIYRIVWEGVCQPIWRGICRYRVPLFLFAAAGLFLLVSQIKNLSPDWIQPVFGVGLGYTAFWVIALGTRQLSRQGEPPPPVEGGFAGSIYRSGATVVAGALQGYLLYLVGNWFALLGPATQSISPRTAMELVFGPALIIATLLLSTVFHMGLSGRAVPDADREWAARAGAVLTLLTLGWIGLFGATLYGPLFVKWLTASHWAEATWGKIFKLLLGVAWAAISAGGALAGKSAQTDSKGATLGWLTKIAPPVFVVGLVLLLSYGVDSALPHLPDWRSQRDGPAKICAPGQVCDQAKETLDRVTAAARKLLSAANLQQMAGAASALDKALNSTAGQDFRELSQQHWQQVQDYMGGRLVICLLICAILSVLLWWRVDVNEFSMHLFYRNRLTRAYLGASQADRQRQTDPFTGFSLNDDLFLHGFTTKSPLWREPLDRTAVPERMSPDWDSLLDRGALPERDSAKGVSLLPYDGPYPVFCTTLNLVRGKELAWQQRMAASFIYTPLYCGYDYFKYTSKSPSTLASTKEKFSLSAYRPTDSFSRQNGPKVGTAVAISGAAASPNMGYHTSPALGFLMAVFNVRLGWWAGNPRHPRTWRKFGPRWGLLYLLRELFPDTSDSMAYVYLSDGGHFENLGIYEMVRRKCRLIVCCDVGHDPEGHFEDLGNAVERCRSDFGVDIDISVDDLKPDPKTRLSKAHFKLGTIRYPANPGAPAEAEGCLLYIKSTLTGDEPADVTAYAAANTVFPNNSTGNQFFDESLFESYRALGQHIFAQVVKAGLAPPLVGVNPQAPDTILQLLENLKRAADDPMKN